MKKKISAYAFGALLAATLVPAAVAHAEPMDEDFTNYLTSHGINLPPAQAVTMAHAMCRDLEAGFSQKDEVDQLVGADKLSQAQAETFIGAATGAYCPNKHSAAKPAGR